MKLHKHDPPAVVRVDILQRGTGNKGLTVVETDAKKVAKEIQKMFNKEFTHTFNPTHKNTSVSISCYYQKGQERQEGNSAAFTVYGLTLEQTYETILNELE